MTTPDTTPVTTWVPTGTDPELLGHIQNKGWAAKTAAEAALDAAKSHRDAEKLIGAPATEIVRLPKKEDIAAWDGVWQRVAGTPKAATEYKFDGVKMTDGTELDPKFVDHLRTTAYKNHLSPEAAVNFAKDMVAFTESTEAADAVTTQAQAQRDRDALYNNWGKNKDEFLAIAKRTAEVFGFDAAAVTKMEGQVGYKPIMEAFLKVGQKMGEDRTFSPNNGGKGTGPLTKEGALARRKELMQDDAWVKRYNEGGMGSVEFKEMKDLIAIERAGE